MRESSRNGITDSNSECGRSRASCPRKETSSPRASSSAEFAAGRPAGSLNVPLLDNDEDTGQLMPNPDFVRVMRANFAADARLLVGCQSGSRSSRAAQMLEAFGFTNVANVPAGYDGWAPSGLPIDAATTPARRA